MDSKICLCHPKCILGEDALSCPFPFDRLGSASRQAGGAGEHSDCSHGHRNGGISGRGAVRPIDGCRQERPESSAELTSASMLAEQVTPAESLWRAWCCATTATDR